MNGPTPDTRRRGAPESALKNGRAQQAATAALRHLGFAQQGDIRQSTREDLLRAVTALTTRPS